jgi:hypothetical protein
MFRKNATAQPNIQTPTINQLTHDEARRMLWESAGIALLSVGGFVFAVYTGRVAWYRLFDWLAWTFILECFLTGLSLVFKDPVLEVAGRGLAFVFVKCVPILPRIRNAMSGVYRSADFDRAAQKAFSEVFERGGSPTRDNLYGKLHFFKSPGEWETWRKRCVEKHILTVGGRGGGLLAVAGIDSGEAWKRWSAPSSHWIRNRKTGKFEEQ